MISPDQIHEKYENKVKIEKEAEENFKSPDLMFKIHNEISKKHLFDDKIKMTTFIVACTAYLQPADRHKSIALKGSRSVGKDNVFKSVLRLFPHEDYLILTNATQAVLEDDIQKYKIIAHSEINLQKKDDKGAGSHLVEAIKQLTEGGMAAMKKDIRTGFKTTLHSQQEQKTVIYGSAEIGDDDDELQTRFIVGAVDASPEKITAVNQNTLNDFYGILSPDTESQWVAYGIRNLLTNPNVILPSDWNLPTDLFDNEDPRAMRDIKRFLSCVSAIAWVHQLQRKTDEQGRIIAEPFDFLLAIILTSGFFNCTYRGLGDARLQKFIDCMNEHLDKSGTLGNEIFNRHDIQVKMGVSQSTIKRVCKGCSEVSIIQFHHKDGNDVFYKRCSKGIQKVFIRYPWGTIKNCMENPRRDLDAKKETSRVSKIPQSAVCELEKWDKLVSSTQEDRSPPPYTTYSANLNTLNETFTTVKEDLILILKESKLDTYPIHKAIKLGFTEEQIQTWLKEGDVFFQPRPGELKLL